MKNPNLSTRCGYNNSPITVSSPLHPFNDRPNPFPSVVPSKLTQPADTSTEIRKPFNVTLMAKTMINTAQIMQPQYRNRHNFMIFGGFLLKSTFELAFTCASAFAHARPKFIALDPSTFENPVPVGSVLYLTATVAYTEVSGPAAPSERFSPSAGENYSAGENGVNEELNGGRKKTRIQVRVDSKIRNIEHGETRPTGQFNYTFEVEKEITVMPQTYRQFMVYLDARRRAKRGDVMGLEEVHEVGAFDAKSGSVME